MFFPVLHKSPGSVRVAINSAQLQNTICTRKAIADSVWGVSTRGGEPRSSHESVAFARSAQRAQAASVASTLVRANASSLRVSALNFRMPSLSLSLAIASSLCSQRNVFSSM